MKGLRIIGRSFKSSSKSIFRNFSLSMASITCTIITLILVSIGILLSYNIKNITEDIENELTIVVFMKTDASEDDVKATESELEKITNIETVIYKSKEEIKEDLAKENDAFSKIVSSWGESDNPLQDSFILTISNVKEINETATTVKNLDNVDLVKYGESVVGELVKIFDLIKNASIILLVALILVTTFLIGNTIKITIFSRRNEIEIMRLVGTGNTIIKLPFLIEGFMLGALGSIIPILITIFGYSFAYKSLSEAGLSNILSVIRLTEPTLIVYYTSLALFAIGAFVGMFGSVRAVRKFLKI